MKILYYGYREWAYKIFNNLDKKNIYLISNDDYSIIDFIKPNLIFFIGWSNIIPSEIVKKYKCVCLHPSPLPKYRGGSPIQNQILNNETESAVSLFLMDDGIDTGDILFQKKISLDGTLNCIFDRIVETGTEGIKFILSNVTNLDSISKKQCENDATFFKRRKPQQSEITIEEIQNSDALFLHNKIRSLANPYPNAYIKCKGGQKLYILDSRIDYEK